jgi:signal recognition particle GTPase
MTPALPAGCVIALLGADGSGKTQLAEALAQRLAQRGIAATLVAVPQTSFDAAALEAYRSHALILLIAPASPTRIDEMLRKALLDANLSFAVVHGEGAEQLANAWNAINAAADPDARGSAEPGTTAAWSWACDKCSDPACEHRLFSDLVAKRS